MTDMQVAVIALTTIISCVPLAFCAVAYWFIRKTWDDVRRAAESARIDAMRSGNFAEASREARDDARAAAAEGAGR